MPRTPNLGLGGYLFIVAGCRFFVVALLGRQVAFTGVCVAFIAIGASYVMRTKRS